MVAVALADEGVDGAPEAAPVEVPILRGGEASTGLATVPEPPGGGTPLLVLEDSTARDGYRIQRDGHLIDTVTFARLIGDAATADRLERARHTPIRVRIGLAVASAALVAGGVAAVVTAPSVPTIRVRPEPTDFDTYDTYQSMYDDWAWRQRRLDAHDEQVGTGAALIGLGTVFGVSVPLVGRDLPAHLREPGWEYPLTEARARVAAYNTSLEVTPTSATITVVLP